jgi:hypothetical protein
MFVPRVAKANENDMKNAAGRFVHWSMRFSGFQKTFPSYMIIPALVTAIPTKPKNVNATGMMASWTYCLQTPWISGSLLFTM